MSTQTPDDAPVTDHPRKHDFVTANGDDHIPFSGVVVEEHRSGGALIEYTIQPWDKNGPMAVTVTIDEQNVQIHPAGRLTVLDDIYDAKYNNR